MRFATPQALWALLLVPAVAALLIAVGALRRRALARFAGGPAWAVRASGQVSEHRRGVKAVCLLVALAAGVLALARPQWGSGTESITRKGIDLVIAIDTSKSMDAEDAPPNRLARAVRAAEKLLDELEGDRVALVTFAGSASVACPLTLDHEAIRLFLEGLDTESVSVGGTALAEAAEASIRALGPSESGAGEAKGRAVLVISDGEDHEGGVEAAERELKRSGVTVFAIGVGTEQGAPIPAGEAGAYKKDRDGKLVTTRLDERPLRALAVETGGRYYRATPAEGEIAEVAKAMEAMDAAGSGTVLRTRWVERFQIPLAVALLALLVETALTDRRKTS
jgi:Ca-activated chloride channel family protein